MEGDGGKVMERQKGIKVYYIDVAHKVSKLILMKNNKNIRKYLF